MTCPLCQERLADGSRACTACGIEIAHLESGLMRTSTVLIASGGKRKIYNSVREVPEPVKTRLMETMQGVNAGTIVIADERGRKRIDRLRGGVAFEESQAQGRQVREPISVSDSLHPRASSVTTKRWRMTPWHLAGIIAAFLVASAFALWLAVAR